MEKKLNFEKDIANVKGWLTKEEAMYLYTKAKQVPKNQIIVEIGSYKGRSTICLAKGALHGEKAHVTAIDPFKALPYPKTEEKLWFSEFKKNLKRSQVDKQITIIRNTSNKAINKINKPIGLLFIDGDHHLANVWNDYKNFSSKVPANRSIIFHDTVNYFGPAIVTMYLLLFTQVKHPKIIDTATGFKKAHHVSFSERVVNIRFLIQRLTWNSIARIYKTFLNRPLKEGEYA